MKISPLAIAAAALIGVAIARPKTASATQRATPSSGSLRDIALVVEQKTGLPGFAEFAEATAWNESRGNPDATNTSRSEAASAARGYDRNLERYGNSGFPRSRYVWGSGGWFGLLPSTALADRAWNNTDPLLVRDRVASVVLLAALAQRVVRNHFSNIPAEHRNWLTIRRFMASNARGYDYLEQMKGTAGRRERFARDYKAVGLNPSNMFRRITAGTRRADPALYQEILAEQRGQQRTQS